MADCRLRVYFGPEDDFEDVHLATKTSDRRAPKSKVTVPLGDILSVLTDAVQQQRGWVADFEDDDVTISTDLYEVILAYQHFRRPSA